MEIQYGYLVMNDEPPPPKPQQPPPPKPQQPPLPKPQQQQIFPPRPPAMRIVKDDEPKRRQTRHEVNSKNKKVLSPSGLDDSIINI